MSNTHTHTQADIISCQTTKMNCFRVKMFVYVFYILFYVSMLNTNSSGKKILSDKIVERRINWFFCSILFFISQNGFYMVFTGIVGNDCIRLSRVSWCVHVLVRWPWKNTNGVLERRYDTDTDWFNGSKCWSVNSTWTSKSHFDWAHISTIATFGNSSNNRFECAISRYSLFLGCAKSSSSR